MSLTILDRGTVAIGTALILMFFVFFLNLTLHFFVVALKLTEKSILA